MVLSLTKSVPVDHLNNDPLSQVIAPPKDESPEERLARQAVEEKARKISDDIDKFLKRDGDAAEKRKSSTVRVLLLGQSECGKSTALKNFQLIYSPQSFQAERIAWRLVVLFNLVHSIRVLHSVVSDALQTQEQRQITSSASSPSSPFYPHPRSPIGLNDYPDLAPRPSDASLQHSLRSNNSNHNSNGGLGETDQANDQTDASSSYSSGAISSSSNSNAKKISFPGRRASLFASVTSSAGNGSRRGSSKGDLTLVTSAPDNHGNNVTNDSGGSGAIGGANASEVKQRKQSPRSADRYQFPHQQQRRPATSTGVSTSALNLPGTTGTGSRSGTGTGDGNGNGKTSNGSSAMDASPNLDNSLTRKSTPNPRHHPRRVASDELQISIGWDTPSNRSRSRDSASQTLSQSPRDGKAPPPPPMSPTTAMTGTFRAGAAPGGQNGTGPWLHPHDGTSRTTSSSHPFRSIRPERNEEAEEDQSVFTNHHQLLLMRLKPILTVEADLLKRLSMPDEDEPVRLDFNLTGMRQAAVNAAKSSNTKVSSGSGQVANVKSSSSTSLPSSSLSTVIPGKANEEARTSNEDEKRRISAESMNESFTETVAKRLKQQGRPRSRSSTDVVPSVTVAQHVDGISAHYPTQPTTTAYVSTSSPSLDKGMTSSNNGNGTSAVKTTEESSSPPPFTLGNVAAIGGVSVGNIIRRVSEGDAGSGVGRDDIVVPEFFVRSPNWKEKFWRWTRYDPTERWVNGRNTNKRSGEWDPWDDPSDPAHFIQACARDLNELWNDSVVQDYLAKKKYKLEHSPGFFLGDVDRIVSRGYVPTDDDILRARLKTIGVTEHQIRVNGIGSMSKDWLMYDVGGTRTQRSAWVPYFDSADAIIFIANLAAFDQTLAEDPAMNRLEDSLRMFRSLVSSPILKNVNIVLFLNKIDLLEVKLNSGIKISKYFGRYGDRPNTVESVIKYFHAKFCAIYEKFTPASSKRAFTVHQTSLTNAPSTRIILDAVSQTIIQAHLQKQVN